METRAHKSMVARNWVWARRQAMPVALFLIQAVGASGLRAAELPQLAASATTRVRLPAPGVRGLAWDGQDLLLLYGAGNSLSGPSLNYRATLVRLNTETAKADTLRRERDAFETGLTFDRENLWSCGSMVGQAAQLYRLDRSSGATQEAFPLPGHHPSGLAFDGTYLWLVDADARKLFRIDIEAAKVSRKIPAPGFYPTGLAFDGTNFWSADAATGRIYRLRGSNAKADAMLAPDAFPCLGRFVSLAWDGRSLWAAAADDSFAVRLELMR